MPIRKGLDPKSIIIRAPFTTQNTNQEPIRFINTRGQWSQQDKPINNTLVAITRTKMNGRVELFWGAILVLLVQSSLAFVVQPTSPLHRYSTTSIYAEEGDKAGPLVSGEELEMMLTELEQPLVIDAYATWCGPCLIMAPEFEAAAQELKGKVTFVKLDTDQEENMAARLNIMGLPTLLFLDKYEPKEGEENQQAKAVLKGRIEGALRKDNIKDLCEHYFFGGPAPELF